MYSQEISALPIKEAHFKMKAHFSIITIYYFMITIFENVIITCELTFYGKKQNHMFIYMSKCDMYTNM